MGLWNKLFGTKKSKKTSSKKTTAKGSKKKTSNSRNSKKTSSKKSSTKKNTPLKKNSANAQYKQFKKDYGIKNTKESGTNKKTYNKNTPLANQNGTNASKYLSAYNAGKGRKTGSNNTKVWKTLTSQDAAQNQAQGFGKAKKTSGVRNKNKGEIAAQNMAEAMAENRKNADSDRKSAKKAAKTYRNSGQYVKDYRKSYADATRAYLKEQGWSKNRINEYLKSDEYKAGRKSYYKTDYTKDVSVDKMAENILQDTQKQRMKDAKAQTEVENKAINGKGKILKQDDYTKMATWAQQGQLQQNIKADNIASKNGKGSGIGKRLAEQNVKDYVNSAGVMGALDQMTQGLSVSTDTNTYKYTKAQKAAMDKAKSQGSYTLGRVIGGAAEFALGGTNAIGKNIASTALKTAGKAALKEAAEQGGKQLTKTVAKNALKEGAADIAASMPLNTLDALKDSYVNGKIDKATFTKSLLQNVALDAVLGGGTSAIGAKMTKKQITAFSNIDKKIKAGETVTAAERDFYTKVANEIANEEAAKLAPTIKKNKEAKAKAEAQGKYYSESQANSGLSTANETRGSGNFYAKGTDLKAKQQAEYNADLERIKAENAEKPVNEYVAADAEIRDLQTRRQGLEDAARNATDESVVQGNAMRIAAIDDKIAKLEKGKPTLAEADEIKALQKEREQLINEARGADTEAEVQRLVNSINEIDNKISPEKITHAEAKDTMAMLRAGNTDEHIINTLVSKGMSEAKATRVLEHAKNVREISVKKQPISATTKATDTTAPKAEKVPAEAKSEAPASIADEVDAEVKALDSESPKTDDEIRAEVDEDVRSVETVEEEVAREVDEIDAEKKALYKSAGVSSTDVTEMSTEALKKERKSLNYVVSNKGKTPEHQEIRKERLAEIKAELDKRFNTKESVQNADELEAAANGEYSKQLENTANETVSSWQAFRQLFVDDKNGFEQLANSIKDKGLRQYVRETINSVRNARNLAAGWITDARYIDGKKTGPSVREILGDFLRKGNEEKYKLFQDYCFHLHNVSRAKQGKEVFGQEFSAAESESLAKKIAEENPEFVAKQQQIVDYFKDLQQYRVDSGLVSKEFAEYLDALYPNYVPTYRLTDGGTISGVQTADIKGMRAASGGDQELKPLHEQMINQTEYTIKMGEQNRLLNVIAASQGIDVKGLDPGITVSDLVQASSNFTAKTDGATWKYSVTFFDNGKPRTVQLTDQMYKGMMDMKNDTSSLTDLFNWKLKPMKYVSAANRIYKGLITGWNVIFGMKNIIKDTGEGLIYTNNGWRSFLANYPKAVSAITNKNSKWRAYFDAYQANGGKFAHIRDVMLDFNVEKAIDIKHPLKTLQNFNDSLEAIPRMAEFIATIEKRGGLDSANGRIIREAMYNANEVTLNFGRGGTTGKLLNSTFIPYLNPAIQGLDKLVRVFKEGGAEGMKGLGSLALKLGAFAMVPTAFNEMVNYAYMAVTGDKSYLDLNNRDKDSNFLIPMGIFSEAGRGQFIKFPQSRVASAVSAPIGHILRSMLYGDGMEWKQMFETAWSNVGVMNPYKNNLFSPIYLTMMNKTWYGGNIQTSYDIALEKNGQARNIYDSTTSQLAIWIGDKINRSPKKIDNIIESYTGGIGDLLPSLPYLGAQAATGNPFYKNFVLDSAFSNKLATDFWDKYNSLESASKISDKGYEKFDSYKNEYSNKVYTLLDAIEYVNSSDSKTKAEDVRKLKIQLNNVYRSAEAGKTCKVEPLEQIAKVVDADTTLSNYLPTSKKDKYNYQTMYKAYKDAIGYKGMTKKQQDKAARDYLAVYSAGVKANYKINPKAQYNDQPGWTFYGIASAQLASEGKISKKNATQIALSRGVYEDSLPSYKKYVKNGGTLDRYIVTEKRVGKMYDNLDKYGIDTDSGVWKNGVKSGATCMSLATSKNVNFKDIAYYIENSNDENVLIKMNAARGFAKKYGRTTEEICKLALKADKKGDQNSYLTQEEIRNACDSMKGNSEEKAMAFVLLGGNPNKNPYGSIGDYSQKNDTGITANKEKSSGGGGGWGHGGWGHGGSGGGSSSTAPNEYKEYSYKKVSVKSGSSGTARNAFKTAAPTPGSSSVKKAKSGIDDAYKRKLQKYIDNLR